MSVFSENSSADYKRRFFRARGDTDGFAFNLLYQILDLRVFKPPIVRVASVAKTLGTEMARFSIQKILLAPERMGGLDDVMICELDRQARIVFRHHDLMHFLAGADADHPMFTVGPDDSSEIDNPDTRNLR